jgi:hypothetical protein
LINAHYISTNQERRQPKPKQQQSTTMAKMKPDDSIDDRKELSAQDEHPPPEEELSPQLIIDQRQKELERERRVRRALAVEMAGETDDDEDEDEVRSSHNASMEFTPQAIMDQRQKELERERRMTSGGAKSGEDSADEGDDCKPAARPEGDVQKSLVLVRGARLPVPVSLPGAFRQDGAGFDAIGDDDIDHEMLTPIQQDATEATVASLSSTMEDASDDSAAFRARRSSGHSLKSATSRNNSLVRASMVDDAEPIFYAEDAVIDRSRRRMIMGIALVAAACVLVISLTILLRETPMEEACTFEEEMCCTVDFDDFSNPKVAPYMCHCLNTTEGLYENLNEVQRMVYNMMKTKLLAKAEITQEFEDALDPNGCHPLNQALLFATSFEALGLSLEELRRASQGVIHQLLAVLIIYTTMDGLNWHQGANWWENALFCGWFGVGCVFVETISSLRLPENGLKGSLPTEIGYLESLRDLDLHGNSEMTGSLPSEIAAMTALDSLDISGSPMGGPVPTVLGNLATLNRLELSACEFSGTFPRQLFRLRAIRFMSLSNNHLYGTLPTEVGELSRLDILTLNGNDLTGTLPSEMETMTNLGLLHIGKNKFSGTIPEFLGRMSNLTMIDLHDSGLSGSIPESFCEPVDQSNAATIGDPTQNDGQIPREQRMTRRVVVNCSAIEFCSCCGATSNQIGIVCGELLPEQAFSDGL